MDPLLVMIDTAPDEQVRALLEMAVWKTPETFQAYGKRLARMDKVPPGLTDRLADVLGRSLLKGRATEVITFHGTVFGDNASPWHQHRDAIKCLQKSIPVYLISAELSSSEVGQVIQALRIPPKALLDAFDGKLRPRFAASLEWLAEHHPEVLNEEFRRGNQNFNIKRHGTMVASVAYNGEGALEKVLAAHPFWQTHSHASLQKRHNWLLSVMTLANATFPASEAVFILKVLASQGPKDVVWDLDKLDTDQLTLVAQSGPSPWLESLKDAFATQRPNWLDIKTIHPATIAFLHDAGLPLDQFRTNNNDTFAHLVVKEAGSYRHSTLQWLSVLHPSLFFVANDQGVRAIDMMRTLSNPELDTLCLLIETTHVHMQAHSLEGSTQPAKGSSVKLRI